MNQWMNKSLELILDVSGICIEFSLILCFHFPNISLGFLVIWVFKLFKVTKINLSGRVVNVSEIRNWSSDKTSLKPCEVFVWDTIHVQQLVLHHEDDPTILGLFVIPNGVTFFHQRDQEPRSLVLTDVFGGCLLLELCHSRVWVTSINENVAHFEVNWLGQVE